MQRVKVFFPLFLALVCMCVCMLMMMMMLFGFSMHLHSHWIYFLICLWNLWVQIINWTGWEMSTEFGRERKTTIFESNCFESFENVKRGDNSLNYWKWKWFLFFFIFWIGWLVGRMGSKWWWKDDDNNNGRAKKTLWEVYWLHSRTEYAVECSNSYYYKSQVVKENEVSIFVRKLFYECGE